MTSSWLPEHVAFAARAPVPSPPVITPAEACRIIPGVDLWDFWPLEREDGRLADMDGGVLWFALAAPGACGPEARHAVARIRLLHQRSEVWRDLGYALPAGFALGSREWSGSSILESATGRVRLFFTAAGYRGETRPSFAQRLFLTTGTLVSGPALRDWSAPREIVASDNNMYVRPEGEKGGAGTIKAFRDPAWFRDPADRRAYVLFAASLGRSHNAANSAIGIARAEDSALDRWSLLPPVIAADGVSNELERPHLRVFGGRYHLFWSTRRQVFAAEGPVGPTGLYGMVADRLAGPWRPLSGSGLIIANPPEAPDQAYGWWVFADGRVASSIEQIAGDPAGSCFGAAPAPELRLSFAGDQARLTIDRETR